MCGDVDAAQTVIKALLAEKQVLRDGHRRHETVFLKHHADAEIPSIQRRLRRDPDSVEGHGSRCEGDDSRHYLSQRRFSGTILPDQRMNLAALKVEIDAVDRRNAGIEFCRLVQSKNCVTHAPNSMSSGAILSLKIRRGPFAIMIRSPSSSTADTTPWFVPLTRLCSE